MYRKETSKNIENVCILYACIFILVNGYAEDTLITINCGN